MREKPVRNRRKFHFLLWLLPVAILMMVLPAEAANAAAASADATAWWVWPLALFVVCFFLGMIAVPAGVGGGVLFVPIVGSFFPFHMDFVRGAGLLVAMASALAAGPSLLKNGMANLRLAMPLALAASISSIAGAMLGLALPANIVQISLGVTILGIAALMITAKKSEFPHVTQPDPLSVALGIHGVFRDGISGKDIAWQVHRTPAGLVLFLIIGFLGGLFGVGAGWANVPGLNLLMGVPLKLAAGSSSMILSMASSSATWYYLNNGAILPIIAVPSVIGMMIGARIGAHLLTILKASAIRKLVIAILLFAGVRTMLKGLGIWI
ncbi:MAG: sulfite exporter TauE/SafE family protein [Nitrosomonadales bacterium]|nr:sulfite exporter TauE/SafE family protein [Nitrosomonadales bacterium]